VGYVYPRGNKLWLAFNDGTGTKQRIPAKMDVGQEKAARSLLKKIEARIAAGDEFGPGPVTVRTYAKWWLEERDRRGIVSVGTNRHQLSHVLPVIGDLSIDEVRPRHIQALVLNLRSDGKRKRGKGGLAPRTVRGIYGTVHTMFEDVAAHELIYVNPCKLRRGQLPKKVDADPSWRAGAVFTRQESELLISHPSIAERRRVSYALKLLAGLRFGEEAALRWRHYDSDIEPLGRLEIVASFDSMKRVEKGTKTEQPRAVPVHPALSKALATWKLSGWTEMVGRVSTPDDLIVPAMRKGEWTHPVRAKALVALHEDLDALGLRRRRQHDMRRTFISLARADGARKDLLEMVTHGQRGDIMDIYTSMPWPALCEEVAKLDVELYAGQVVALSAVTGGRPGSVHGPSRQADSKTQTKPVTSSRVQVRPGSGKLSSEIQKRGGDHEGLGTVWAQREKMSNGGRELNGWGTSTKRLNGRFVDQLDFPTVFERELFPARG